MKVARTIGICLLLILAMTSVPGSATAAPGKMTVSCVNWFLTAGHQDHIHVEVHIADDQGKPLVGALVSFENTIDTHDGSGPRVYQAKTAIGFF